MSYLITTGSGLIQLRKPRLIAMQFSLRDSFHAVTIAAVLCGVLYYSVHPLLSIFLLIVGLFLALVAASLYSGWKRAFWTGFGFAGWLWLSLTLFTSTGGTLFMAVLGGLAGVYLHWSDEATGGVSR